MRMPDSEAKKAWIKANTTQFGIKLNNRTDAELIKKLKEQESYAAYIKRLIREDIKSSK